MDLGLEALMFEQFGLKVGWFLPVLIQSYGATLTEPHTHLRTHARTLPHARTNTHTVQSDGFTTS